MLVFWAKRGSGKRRRRRRNHWLVAQRAESRGSVAPDVSLSSGLAEKRPKMTVSKVMSSGGPKLKPGAWSASAFDAVVWRAVSNTKPRRQSIGQTSQPMTRRRIFVPALTSPDDASLSGVCRASKANGSNTSAARNDQRRGT